MLRVPAKLRIFLCTKPVDFRKRFDGLHGLVLEVLKRDPLSGDLFAFLNKRRDRLKPLVWEGDGWLILYKRLESGRFGPPVSQGDSMTLSSAQNRLALGRDRSHPDASAKALSAGQLRSGCFPFAKILFLPERLLAGPSVS